MPWRTLPEPPNDADTAAFIKHNTKKARLLVDESLGVNVTEVLREAGWNVKDSSEVGLTGHSDEDVFAFAYRDDRILLTHDEDFLDDRRFPPHRNPGVIVLAGASGGDLVLLEALFRALSIIGYFREIYRASKSTITPDGILTISHRIYQTGAIERTRYRVTKNRTEEWME